MLKSGLILDLRLVVRAGVACLVVIVAGFIAGCPEVVVPPGGTTPTPQAFTDADVARGGAMYDMWWAVTGAAEPTSDHPLWASRPDTTTNTRGGADTWRCKECHGWDYKGVDGAYAAGSHRTGIAGIFGTTAEPQDVFDLIKDNHGYGAAGLADADIWDLGKFVLEGQIDTDDIIDADGTFVGDATRGETLYDSGIGTNAGCAACHGSDGLTPPPGAPADFNEFPGMLANENPWELQHKVRFGMPGTVMPGAVAGGGTLQDVADTGAFEQTLPASAGAGETVSFSAQIQPILDANCIACHVAGEFADLLHLNTEESYDALVGQPSAQDADLTRVTAGDSAASLLYLKVSSDSPPVGARMPLGGAALSDDDIALISDWIDQGAENN